MLGSMAEELVEKWRSPKILEKEDTAVGKTSIEGKGSHATKTCTLIGSLLTVRTFNHGALWMEYVLLHFLSYIYLCTYCMLIT